MGKIKVYEMARKIGMSNKDFLMKLDEWGIELKSHLNVIEDDDMKKIQEKLNETKSGSDKKMEKKPVNKIKPISINVMNIPFTICFLPKYPAPNTSNELRVHISPFFIES